jgi:hypothetical protein
MPKAVSNITPVSPFHNLPAGEVADQLVAQRLLAGFEIGDLGFQRAELIRRGVSEIEGALFCATITDAVRWTLDSKTVRAEMGEAWWNARCRQAMVMTVAVKARTAAVKLAA